MFLRGVLDSALTVANQVQEDLQQAVVVDLHQRHPVGDAPGETAPDFPDCRLGDDAGLVQHGPQVGHYRGAARRHAHARRGDLLQAFDDRPQGLEVFGGLRTGTRGEPLVGGHGR